MERTIQERAALAQDFINAYNEKWGETWEIEILNDADLIYIFRKNGTSADGHFIRSFADFCTAYDLPSALNASIDCILRFAI